MDAAALRRVWPEVLEVVKQASRRARALLDNAQIVDVAGELVHLSAPAALARMIADESNTSILREALTRVVGGTWRVDVRPEGAAPARGAGPPATPPPPEPDPRDDTEPEPPGDRPGTVDPDAEALRLLQSELGARPIEGG
jgi:DNA polymerase-3 subunit gamma/tau